MNAETKIADALSGIVSVQEHLVGLGKPRPSFAERLLKSRDFADFVEKKSDLLTAQVKSAITSTSAQDDPLVASAKPFIAAGPRMPLTVRRLLREFQTQNGAVELPIRTVATNGAAVQAAGSPLSLENVTMGESAYTFQTSLTPIRTVGHWIQASSQILEDAGSLDGFVQGELLQGLEEAIENQLVNGTGSDGQLWGLLAGATSYSPASPLDYTAPLDIIRDALYQVSNSRFRPDAILLNPLDWRNLELVKDTDYRHLVALHTAVAPMLFGVPVVVCHTIPAGTFLVGDLRRASLVFQREPATVQIARADGYNFQKSMVTIKAVERLCQVIVNPDAMRKGSL